MDNDRAIDLFLASVERQAFRMAVIATGSKEDALDIVQDAMLGLVHRYGSKPADQWKPLFFRVLQSRIRDWYRRQKVRNRWRVWFGAHQQEDTWFYCLPNGCIYPARISRPGDRIQSLR